MKLKKIIPLVLVMVLVFVGIYTVFFTNFIFNHSCVGVTYASMENSLGVDLVLRYFDSERAAKKLYKAENLETYYLVAVDADNNKGYRNTEEWFRALEAPLVYDNEKFVQTNSLNDFAEEHELMLYSKGPGLDDGYVNDDELDNTVQLYQTGSEWMSISENCTEAEDTYHFRHCAFAFSLECDFDRYKISLEQNDEYSKRFWHYQLSDLCKNWDLPEIPTTNRPSIDWNEIDKEYSKQIAILKAKVALLDSGSELTEKDWDEINTATLSYAAKVVSLSRDLNSEEITAIKTEKIEIYSSEAAVITGTIQTNEGFPAYCLVLDNEFEIILKELDSSKTYHCNKLYFYDDAEVNGGYDYSSLVGKSVSVTALLEDYRGGGEIFLCNPVIKDN